MTLTLEISPELEARVRDEAAALGVTPEAAALEAVRTRFAAQRETDETKRRALIRSLRGRAKGRGPTVDEFLAERSAEARAEAGL